MGLILFGLLSILIGILTFIFRGSLAIAIATLENIKKVLKSEDSDSDLKKVALGTKKVLLTAKMVAVKTSIRVLRLLIFIARIFAILFSLITMWQIILVVVLFTAVLICISTFSVLDFSDLGSKTITSNIQILDGYDYNSIDWSQDFSQELSRIESTYGKVDRDWVELAIISMNTQQNLNSADIPVLGYTIGSVAVESGGGDFMATTSGNPMSAFSLKHTDKGLSWSTGGNPVGADGLFQITNSGWTLFNPLYVSYSNNLSPVVNASTEWYTQRYYIPSAVYGTLSRYKSILLDTDNYSFTSVSDDSLDSITRAFNLMGISMTTGKFNYVKNACLASYAYGGLTSRCYDDSVHIDAKHELATNIALFVLTYCETYLEYSPNMDTYYYSSSSSSLASSILSTVTNSQYSIGLTNSFCKSMYGTTGDSVFSSQLSVTGDWGVLTASGGTTDLTLMGYLYTQMSPSAVSFLNSTMSYTLDVMSSNSMHARCYYDLSMLIASNYVLDKTVIALGFQSDSSISWVNSCSTMAEWYAENVTTYCSNSRASTNGTASGRTWYYCDLVGGTVGDDCSAFVTAALGYAGIIPNYTGSWGYRSSNFFENSGSMVIAYLINAGFTCSSISSSWVPQAGDITFFNGHVEVIAYVQNGVVYSYTWGDNYSNYRNDGGGGEPQRKYSVDTYRVYYDYYWRE